MKATYFGYSAGFPCYEVNDRKRNLVSGPHLDPTRPTTLHCSTHGFRATPDEQPCAHMAAALKAAQADALATPRVQFTARNGSVFGVEQGEPPLDNYWGCYRPCYWLYSERPGDPPNARMWVRTYTDYARAVEDARQEAATN